MRAMHAFERERYMHFQGCQRCEGEVLVFEGER